jgi:hypothetical protein
MPLPIDKQQLSLALGVTALVAAVLSVLAAATPQWFVVFPNGFSYGLGTACAAGGCRPTNYRTAVCDGVSVGEHWHNRESTVTAFIWIAIVLLGLVLLLQSQVMKGNVKVTKVTAILPIAMTGAAVLLLIIALIIYGHTVDNFIGCGKSFCDMLANGKRHTCGYGASFACAIVGVVFAVLSLAPLAGQLGNTEQPQHDGKLRTAGFALSALAAAFLLIGATTYRWIVNNDEQQSLGLFDTCTGSSCKANSFRGTTLNYLGTTTSACARSGDAFDDRNKTVGAFFIIAFFVLAASGVAALMGRADKLPPPGKGKGNLLAAILAAVAFVFQGVGYIIFGSTWNSWLLCGNNFCNTTHCNYGFATVCALATLVLAAAVAVVGLLDTAGVLQYADPVVALQQAPSPLKQQADKDAKNGGKPF